MGLDSESYYFGFFHMWQLISPQKTSSPENKASTPKHRARQRGGGETKPISLELVRTNVGDASARGAPRG